MTTQTLDPMTEHLTEAQADALHLFREELERRLPQYCITAVQPLKENAVRVWLESPALTYQSEVTVSKLAVEVENETGIFIILR